jgi:peptidoglycan/LPS O-acetylase OafA/YrhL
LTLNYYGALFHGEATLFLGWAWLLGFTYQRCRTDPASGPLLVAVAVGLCSINTVYNRPYSQLTILAVTISLVCGGNAVMYPLMKRVANFLGDLSYPLYLFHFPGLWVLPKLMHHHTTSLAFLAAFGVSCGALALDHLLQHPLQRMVVNAGHCVASAKALQERMGAAVLRRMPLSFGQNLLAVKQS